MSCDQQDQQAKIPIILSEDITELEPAYFWFSGGRINVKMGISVVDFLQYFGNRVIVAKITWFEYLDLNLKWWTNPVM